MKKLIVALMTAVTLLFGSVQLQPENKVSAEEYEKNILISCESKEIDINDIPENREVELNVSIENNPGFIALGMYVKYDLRLGIDNYRMCKEVEGADGIVYKPSASFTKGEDGFSRVHIFTEDDHLSQNDEVIAKFSYIIPEDAKVGDIYNVEFIKSSDYTTFFFLPNNKEMYREEYFSDYTNGYIEIVGKIDESDNPIISIPSEEIIQPDSGVIHETETAITEASKEQVEDTSIKITGSTTAVNTYLTEQTSITSVLSTVVTTIPVTSSSTEVSTSEINTSQNSTSVTEKTEHDEVNKRSYLIPIALSAMIIAAVAVVIAKRKRSK